MARARDTENCLLHVKSFLALDADEEVGWMPLRLLSGCRPILPEYRGLVVGVRGRALEGRLVGIERQI